ncbi:hypothetical protein T4D_11649 [Trichinella pseudospiralis]|uniref:Uncharacterized protein n=1 Tax=Trichinella pseudospiralis TaxID=6337 RepID=A0A0V1DW46_TRIPS|nr:hypothetical protein T4D_11649 [Trichinella pseudospiralis]
MEIPYRYLKEQPSLLEQNPLVQAFTRLRGIA